MGTTPSEVFWAARRAGYETVQYNMTCSGLSALPRTIDEETTEAIRAATAQTGVSIEAISATYNMIHPNLRERSRGRQAFEAIAGAARRMGTRLLTVCTGTYDPQDQWRCHPANSSDTAWEELCKEFQLVLAIAGEHDLLIGVEPEPANVISSAGSARKLLDTFGDDRIRIVFDPANLVDTENSGNQKSVIENAVDLLGDSIALVHAKDRLPDGLFAAAGSGILDYTHLLTILQKAGFRGGLIAHGITSNQAEIVATFLKSQLAAVEAGS